TDRLGDRVGRLQPRLGGLEPPVTELIPRKRVSAVDLVLERKLLDPSCDCVAGRGELRENPPVLVQHKALGLRDRARLASVEADEDWLHCVPQLVAETPVTLDARLVVSHVLA